MRIIKICFLISVFLVVLTAQDFKLSSDSTKAAFDLNKIHFSFNNYGVLGDVRDWEDYSGITYNDVSAVYSAGFYLSGIHNNDIWTNGVLSVAMVMDYIPGLVGSKPTDKNNKIYPLFSTDRLFSKNWREWKKAVAQGANYYDGDKNGKYDPIDHNGNGLWEINEDRPGLMYDQTYFTVFHDGIPANQRRLNNVEPLGIEIRQTIFASENLFGLDNTIFVRYSILNTGLKTDTLNEVIFSLCLDPDLGYMNDDLVGCDTMLNSGFAYNDGPDSLFGEKPPVLHTTFIQTPIKYTGNLRDTAIVRYNSLTQEVETAGYTNTEFVAHTNYYFIGWSDFVSAASERNRMLGRYYTGEIIDPCNWELGEVFDDDCSQINPLFWYSGDPLTKKGWINTFVNDQRQLISTGLFELIKDQPQEIIIAYTLAEGYNNIPAFSVARERIKEVFREYNANFPNSFDITDLPNDPEKLTYDFTLEQNFPNPFNPATTIRYSIKGIDYLDNPERNKSVNTKLIVYDIIGRKVKTLVNEIKAPGPYEVQLNASQFASGVYFYRLTAGDFVQTKKMILLR